MNLQQKLTAPQTEAEMMASGEHHKSNNPLKSFSPEVAPPDQVLAEDQNVLSVRYKKRTGPKHGCEMGWGQNAVYPGGAPLRQPVCTFREENLLLFRSTPAD